MPPPFGGVTVHVRRVRGALRAAGLAATVYDTDGRRDPSAGVVPAQGGPLGFLRFAARVQEPVVALHTSSLAAMVLAAAALGARGRALVPMLHSMAPVRAYDKLSPLGRALVRATLGRAHGFVRVNEALAAWVRGPLAHRGPHVVVLPAFLPPAPAERDVSRLPGPVRRFAAEHPLLLSSQGLFGYFVDGRHVYGFEDLARLLEALRRRDPRWGLVTLRTGTYDAEHRRAIFALRRDLHLDDHWLILEEPVAGPALYASSRAFLRPTATDGDSVSIREALLLGVPVVASDAVPRPPGAGSTPSVTATGGSISWSGPSRASPPRRSPPGLPSRRP